MKLLKIDIHTHIMPEHLPNYAQKFGYGGFVSLEHHKPCCAKMMIDDKFFREIQDNCWSAETRMHECEATGVDVQVLSTIPVLFNYWAKPQDCLDSSMFLNDHIASVVDKYPKRFIGLGTVPMQDTVLAIKELRRCILDLHMAGIQIGSHVNDMNLDHEQLFPIFEEAERLGASIFVHPWDMMGKEKMPKYWLPWLVGMPAETSLAICCMIFGGIFEKLPNLRVAFAHGGGSFPATIGRIEHGFNVRPDLCAVDNNVNPRDYLGKFYLDSLVHDEDMLRMIIKQFGVEKIAMGSDYPFPLGELHPGKLIEQSNFDDYSKNMLLHGAALHWLNLEKKNYI
jgi:aminocarboxymuconate-semialdehyde decarboxylase